MRIFSLSISQHETVGQQRNVRGWRVAVFGNRQPARFAAIRVTPRAHPAVQTTSSRVVVERNWSCPLTRLTACTSSLSAESPARSTAVTTSSGLRRPPASSPRSGPALDQWLRSPKSRLAQHVPSPSKGTHHPPSTFINTDIGNPSVLEGACSQAVPRLLQWGPPRIAQEQETPGTGCTR